MKIGKKLITVGFISIMTLIYSCQEKNKEDKKTEIPEIVKIKLESRGKDNPFGIRNSPFGFLDSIPSSYKGIVNRDSSKFVFMNTIPSKILQELKSGDELPNNELERSPDSIYGLSGIHEGKQYYVFDLNNNKDFGDDKLEVFEKNLYEDADYKNKFPLHSILVKKYENGKFFMDSLFIRIYPDPNYFKYPNETASEKFTHSLQLVGQIHNYQYGTFNVGEMEFKVALFNSIFGDKVIFQNIEKPFYNRTSSSFSEYQIKDTLRLNGFHFRIDSLSYHPQILTLQRIEIKDPITGFRKGDIAKNYLINDLSRDTTTLKKLFAGKDYVLLDFWGTWCAPCKELTPELVKLHQSHGDKVSFVSLAFQQDPQPVLDYVVKNNMKWFNGWIKGVPKSGDDSAAIISGLRIECYPTFLVLDKDLKILFRSCGGGQNFLDLVAFLESELIER